MKDHLFGSITRIRLLGMTALLFGLSFIGVTSESKAATIRIDNYKNEKVKVCAYRSTDKTWLRPLKCWTLKKGVSVNWNRGKNTFSFDVRVFRPGIIDKRLCQKRGIRNISRLYINPRTPCVTFMKRTNRPPPNTVPVKEWNLGNRVLVNRGGDAYWYPATIIKRSFSQYQVRFAKGSRATVNARYISGDYIRTGTRIYGNWKNRGRYYPGRIAERTGNQVRIDYDDGDKETTMLAFIRLTFRNLPKAPIRYSLRVCNRSMDDRVYFSIAFAISPVNYVSEGWWFVNKGGCINVDLSKRWQMKGVPSNLRSRTYIYGETKGIFGGAIKRVMKGGDPRNAFCLNQNKETYFANKRYNLSNGVRRNVTCSSSNKEMVNMAAVNFPSSGGLMRWNF